MTERWREIVRQFSEGDIKKTQTAVGSLAMGPVHEEKMHRRRKTSKRPVRQKEISNLPVFTVILQMNLPQFPQYLKISTTELKDEFKSVPTKPGFYSALTVI